MKRVFQDITNVSDKNIKLVIKKSGHRRKLLRWLFEVVLDFRYSQVTYARAVYVIDRYVLTKGLDLAKYQLLGIAALFVCAKVEETTVKKVKEYVAVTEFSCGVSEVLDMERHILELCGYDLCFLLPHYYVTAEELARIGVDLGVRGKRDLFYAVISYLLESEESSGNVYNFFVKCRTVVGDVVARGARGDMRLYIDDIQELSKLLWTDRNTDI